MKKRSIISALTASAMTFSLISLPTFAEDTSSNVILSENFDGITEGANLADVMDSSVWEVYASNPGDGVTVETDPVTNSKAVKITQTKQTPAKNSNPLTGFFLNFTPASEGKTTVKFKIREEVNTANLSNRFFMKSGIGSAFDFYQIKRDLHTTAFSKFAEIPKDSYADFTVVYDAKTYLYKVKAPGYEKEFQSDRLVDQLQFAIGANYYNGATDWIGTEEGDPVYWIDDIEITKEAVNVESITPASGAVITPDEQFIIVDFNCDVDLMNLTSEYIKILEDGVEIEDADYMKDFEDSTKVIITLPDGFKSGKKYTVNVLKGIGSSSGVLSTLQAEKKCTFKCLNESVIVDEDFEEIDEGTKFADAFDSTTWPCKDANAGDSVTIETDPTTGSKAVKITQKKQTPAVNSNPETGFWLNFNPVENGITNVSFKIRQEVNSANLSNSMFMTANKGTVFNFYQITKTMYTTAYLGMADFSSSSYTKFDISYDSESYTYTIKSGDRKQVITSDRLLNQLRFAIAANFQTGASNWIGSDEGDPVYWIDDIKITKECVAVTNIENAADKLNIVFNTPIDSQSITKNNFKILIDEEEMEGYSVAQDATNPEKVVITLPYIPEYDSELTINIAKGIKAVNTLIADSVESYSKRYVFEAEKSILSENFNGYTSDIVLSKHADWTVASQGTGSVTVDTDAVSGSKAIKIVAEKSNMSNSGVTIPFTKVTSGKVKVSFNLRDENDSLLFTKLSLTSGYSTQVTALKCSGTIYDYNQSGKWQNASMLSMNGAYHKIDYIVDLESNTYNIAVDDSVVIKNASLRHNKGTGIEAVNIYVSANYNEFGADASWLPKNEGDGIYWIDDISVSVYNYPVIYSESIANGAKNVSVKNPITYTFDMDMDDKTINKNTVKLYADDIEVSDYSVSYSNREVTVNCDKLAFETNYKVVMDSTIKSAAGDKVRGSTTYEFTTEENPENFLSMQVLSMQDAPVEDISEFGGSNVKVLAEVRKNLSGYTFYAAVKDATGKLLSVAKIDSTSVLDTSAEVTLSVPTTVTDDCVVEGFLFDTASQAPLSGKKSLKKN